MRHVNLRSFGPSVASGAALLLALALGAAIPSACGGDDGDRDAADAVEDVDDAGGADEITPEPVSKVTFTVGGIPRDFRANARADFFSSNRELRIAAADNNRRIEIRIFPADPGATGTFTPQDIVDGRVVVCYDDGTTTASFSECGDTFTHQSDDYDLEITTNGSKGGRVIGTVTATLRDGFTNPLPLLNGVFDVKYR